MKGTTVLLPLPLHLKGTTVLLPLHLKGTTVCRCCRCRCT